MYSASALLGQWQCFDANVYLDNSENNWDGTSCYDTKGNSYKEHQSMLSCCGCLEMTCTTTQITTSEYMQIKSFWNITISSSCCQDCHGKVFPVGSVMSTGVMDDECATTVTKQCVHQNKGNQSQATISVRFETKLCCSDTDGLHPLSNMILDPSSCSSRRCSRKEGNLFAGWISTALQPGCNCCLHQGKLVAEGANVTLPSGVDAKCCEGKLLVPLREGFGNTVIITSTTSSGIITSTTSTSTSSTTTKDSMTTEQTLEVQRKIWEIQHIFSPPTSTVPGEWGPLEMCPPLAYAVGFELKVAPLCTKRCKPDDDIALMGIRLHCISLPSSQVKVDTTITSASNTIKSKHRDRRTGRPLEPYFTNYQSCTDGTYLQGARYLSEPFNEVYQPAFTCPPGQICTLINPTGVDDPTGGQNIDMNCTITGQVLQGEGVHTGDAVWLDWNTCPDKMAICGVRSRTFDEMNDYYQNMGQVQVEFHCCQLYD